MMSSSSSVKISTSQMVDALQVSLKVLEQSLRNETVLRLVSSSSEYSTALIENQGLVKILTENISTSQHLDKKLWTDLLSCRTPNTKTLPTMITVLELVLRNTRVLNLTSDCLEYLTAAAANKALVEVILQSEEARKALPKDNLDDLQDYARLEIPTAQEPGNNEVKQSSLQEGPCSPTQVPQDIEDNETLKLLKDIKMDINQLREDIDQKSKRIRDVSQEQTNEATSCRVPGSWISVLLTSYCMLLVLALFCGSIFLILVATKDFLIDRFIPKEYGIIASMSLFVAIVNLFALRNLFRYLILSVPRSLSVVHQKND